MLTDTLVDHAHALYAEKETDLGAEALRKAEQFVLLRVIDRLWIQHLTEIDMFRQGVGLQAYGQQDPLVTYKREAFDMFDQLTASIRLEVARTILHLQRAPATPAALRTPVGRPGVRSAADIVGVRQVQERSSAGVETATASGGAATATIPKVGRNAPCPCGSGKKYKKCHGAAV